MPVHVPAVFAHVVAWAHLFACLLCTRVTNSWHGHTCLRTFCVPVLAVPMPAVSLGHQVCGSDMVVHTHAMFLLFVLGKICLDIRYAPGMLFGGLGMYVPMCAMLQCYNMVAWPCLFTCLPCPGLCIGELFAHLFAYSLYLNMANCGPGQANIVYMPTLSQCHTWQCGHVCSHACHAFVLPLGNLGMPVCILVVFQFYAWQNCLQACCVPVSLRSGLDMTFTCTTTK